jgi:hypothetical protein
MEYAKKKFLPLLLLGCLMISSISCLDAVALIQISPNQLNTSLTSPFTVQIELSNVNNLYAFAVDVSFDPGMIRMDSIVQEAALSEDGSVNTFFFHNIDNTNGLAIIGITRSVTTGVNILSPQAVISISFTPINSGSTQIQLGNVGLIAPDGYTSYPANVTNGEVTITGSSPGINLFFDPESYQAEIPEIFTVDLMINHIDDLFSFAGDIAFDPSIITIEEVTEGQFLNESGDSPTIFMADIDNSSGTCIIGITRLSIPPTGVSTSSEAVVLTLKFRSQQLGVSSLILTNTGLIAPNGVTSYDHTADSGSVSVSVEAGHSNLSFSPSSADIQEHELLISTVEIDRVTDLYGFATVVNFDPERLEAIELTERDFLNANGSVPTSFVYDIDNDIGTITVGLSRLGDVSGASSLSPMALFSVTFRAISAGNDSVFLNNIGLIAPDAVTLYPCIASNLSVLITDSASISNLQAMQRTDGTMLVDVFYDLSHPSDDQLSVGMLASNDNGLSWSYSCSSFLDGSDVGEDINPGLAKHIVWDIATEHPETTQELLLKLSILDTDAYAVSAPFPVNTIGAQSESYILGTVKDQNDVPLSDVELIITGMDYNQQSQTNNNGQFTIGNLSVSQVNIHASKEGYESTSQTSMLYPGANICNLTLVSDGTQLSSIAMSSFLTISANTIIQEPTGFYTLSGEVSVNDVLLLPDTVTLDMRANLAYPKLSFQGAAHGIGIDGTQPVIIPNIDIPIVYSVRNNRLVPTQFSYFAESGNEVCGFTIEIGMLTISESQSLGKYVEIMGLLKQADDGFFGKIMNRNNWVDSEQAPQLYIPELESISVSMFYSEHAGLSYGCNISGVSCNFGAFSVENFSLWIDPNEDVFGGNLRLKIPGIGSLRDISDSNSELSGIPVNITVVDTGETYETDLENIIEMHRQGIFSFLEIDATLEFIHGRLNNLSITLSGMNIPIFSTGTFIREIYGGIYDMAVNDLRIEASVDIGLHSSLDIPALGPVVYLDDVGVIIKPWSYFNGGGAFQVFKQPVSDGKFFYDGSISALGLEANLKLMTQINNPGSAVLRGQMYGNVSASNFNAGLNAQIQTPDDLPWYLWWAAGVTLASADVSIHNFELSTMLQLYKLSLAQKFEYGKPTFPYFHYYLGSNYKNMYQLWKGSRDGMQTIDFQVPDNAKQILIVAGNNSNLFDFMITSPSNVIYDNTYVGYQQFATTNQTIMVIDYPKPGDWSFSTAQQGDIITDFKVMDQPPYALVTMPAIRGSRDNTIKLSMTDYSDTLNVKVYYNTKNRHFDGVFIQEFTVFNNADLEFVWHNSHLDNGEYYIYTRIDDGKNAPVLQYAPGSILVNNYYVPEPQNVNATMLNGVLMVSWDNPDSGDIILTEILLEDVYNKSRYSYSVMDVNHSSITDLPIGREYEIRCRFVNNLYQKSDYSSAGTIVLSDETRSVTPYFTMDKDEVWWFVENQPKSYSLSAANPAGGPMIYYMPEGQTGMSINGDQFSWTPAPNQKGFYQQPLLVTNGPMTDTLYQQIVVYSEEQAELKVSFSSYNLYEADRMFVKINNLFSDEPFQVVYLTNLSSNTQVAVTCRKVNKFEYIGQFSLSMQNRSEIPVSDGDAIEASYTFNGNTFNAISIYSSEPQAFDNIAPASVTDLRVTNSDMDKLKLLWTATGDNGHSGRAYRYDLRYSYQPIQTNDDFFVANLFPTNLYPAESGMLDSLTINIQDLPNIHQYDKVYFALVVEDTNQNRSDISNGVFYSYFASPIYVDASLVNDALVEINWSEFILPREIQNLNTKSKRSREEVDFTGYQLWREHNGVLSLLADSLSVMTYTDNITSLSDGNLRYGVKALYVSGVSSTRLSNVLQLNRLTDIRILCQQDSLSPASNVQYSIVGQDDLYQHSFIGQTNSSGIILLDNVYQSTYRITLSKEGCFPAIYTLDFVDYNPEIVIDVYSALAPEPVYIELMNNQVLLCWNPVRGAGYYKIYASTDPMALGELISTQSDTSIMLPIQGEVMFFKVTSGCDDE